MNETRWRRARTRGVTLVEVLIVVAIMATIAGAVTLVAFPELRKARVHTAAMGALAVREAAQIYKEVDLVEDAPACPSVQDLVATRKLAPDKTADPWGTPFRVLCEDQDFHGVSNGRDHKPDTADDVRDDIRPADVERIAAM
jgi:general secretion pathway protein G